MRTAVPLFLEDDTIEHIDWICEQMSRQRNQSTSRSDAVEWLVRVHWKKMKAQQLERA